MYIFFIHTNGILIKHSNNLSFECVFELQYLQIYNIYTKKYITILQIKSSGIQIMKHITIVLSIVGNDSNTKFN